MRCDVTTWRADAPGSTHWTGEEVRGPGWVWECTCGIYDDCLSSQHEAEQAGEGHRIDVATEQMIDAGELP